MRRLGLVAFMVLVGCGSDDGTAPTVSGVFPAEGFIGRQVRVEVSGDATSWSDSTTISFGPDVMVGAVTVASPTDLFADLTIKDTATAGLTDVTVADGSDSFALTQSFNLRQPVDVQIDGTLAQGSIAFLTLVNHDVDNPFDSSDDGSQTFPNISFNVPASVEVQLSGVTPSKIDAVLLMNTDAAAGDFSVVSGSPDSAVTSPATHLDIKARAATAITAGTPVQGLQKDAFETALYQFTPGTVPTLTRATVTGSDNATVIVVPSSGRMADFLVITSDFEQLDLTKLTSDSYYLVFFDNTGTSGYSYTITPNNVDFTTQANEVTTSNQTGATAQLLAGTPAILNNANITSATDADFVKFTVTAGDATKKVHVITTGGALTDTIVDVYTNVGATNTLGESADTDFQENFVSEPIPAGTTTIWVKIAASPFWAMDPQTTPNYVAAIFLED